ncbi:MAG: hypothetical protein E7073_06720 [Bacteroidales bacterium]|jgi:hypothetical protein|nr:hypothetical protein [Bacteroidales bacterium]
MGYLRGNGDDLRVVTGAYEEHEVVDAKTGEIKSVLRTKVSLQRARAERYVVWRVTEGCDHIMEMDANEIKLLFLISMQCVSSMLTKKGMRHSISPLGGLYNRIFAEYMGVSKSTVARTIRKLEARGALVVLDNGGVMVSPDYVFTNGVKTYLDDKEEFDRCLLMKQREKGRQLGAGELLTTEEKESLFEKGGGK